MIIEILGRNLEIVRTPEKDHLVIAKSKDRSWTTTFGVEKGVYLVYVLDYEMLKYIKNYKSKTVFYVSEVTLNNFNDSWILLLDTVPKQIEKAYLDISFENKEIELLVKVKFL